MVANPTPGLRAALRKRQHHPRPHLQRAVSPFKAWLKAIRIHQWAKNVLIFLPLLLAHALGPGPHRRQPSSPSSASASAPPPPTSSTTSSTSKPTASTPANAAAPSPQETSPPSPASSSSSSFSPPLSLWPCSSPTSSPLSRPSSALVTPHYFLLWLGIYLVTTLAYSLRLKRAVLVDVIVLSGLYTIRIIAGSAATGIAVSTWLGRFSIFFFLSLAFVKRFAELENLRERGGDIRRRPRLPRLRHRAAPQLRLRQRLRLRRRPHPLHLQPRRSPALPATPTASGSSSRSFSSGSAASGSRPPGASSTKTPSSTPSPTAAASSSASSSSPSSSPPSTLSRPPLALVILSRSGEEPRRICICFCSVLLN